MTQHCAPNGAQIKNGPIAINIAPLTGLENLWCGRASFAFAPLGARCL